VFSGSEGTASRSFAIIQDFDTKCLLDWQPSAITLATLYTNVLATIITACPQH
jgi:hypothetical protein